MSTDLNEITNTTTCLENLLNLSINSKSCNKSIDQSKPNKDNKIKSSKQGLITKEVYNKNSQSL